MDIHSYFPHIWCVNLDRRPERWERTRRHLAEHGIHKVHRFSAVDGKASMPDSWQWEPGAYGCLQSHLELVRHARREGFPNILIFEDDVVLDPNIQARFAQSIPELPNDWGMLFLGADHLGKPQPFSGDIHRIDKSYSTFAYALNANIYDAFIELNTQAPAPVDHNNWDLQAKFPCYGFMPHLAWVEDGYSDTQNLPFNPWWIARSMVAKGPEADKLLKKTLAVFPLLDGNTSPIAVRNLLFILKCYRAMNHLEMVVVERAQSSVVPTEQLPTGCHHLLLPNSPDRYACFQTAIDKFGQGKELLALLDYENVVAGDQFRACLAMCEQYDIVPTHGKELILDPNHTQTLIQSGSMAVDLGIYTPQPVSLQQHECFFITSQALPQLNKDPAAPFGHISSRFSTPGLAIKLSLGSEA